MINIKQITRWLIDITFWACILVIGIIGMQVFLFSSFKIPSDSMEPELIAGDNVLVTKWIPGARLFNIFDSLEGKQVKIYRTPGFRKIRRNDVVVFNFPHPDGWDKIEMHLMKYYIKRCIGIPGDTIEIKNGFYHIKGINKPLGNMEAQKRISQRSEDTFEKGVYNTFPFDSVMGWNIKNFGPLPIPRKDIEITMDQTNYRLYKKVIEWEQQANLERRDSIYYLKNQPITSYQFLKNYYFVGGDRSEDSQDSRYWGLLPEEYIVGKASWIWKSKDPYSEKIRWERVFKHIN